MTTRVVNLLIEMRMVTSPLVHLQVAAPAQDVSGSSEIELTGKNYNMAAAVVKLTRVSTVDSRVARVSGFAGTELHLPQRPSKWTAITPGIGTVLVGTCTSVGAGTTRFLGTVSISDTANMHVADAPIECDALVVLTSKLGP